MVPIIAAEPRSSGRLQAASACSLRQCPSSSSSRWSGSIIAGGIVSGGSRGSSLGKATNSAVVADVLAVDLAGGEGQREQHAVGAAVVQRFDRVAAGLLAQEQLAAPGAPCAAAAGCAAAGTARSSGSRSSAARRRAACPRPGRGRDSSSASRSRRCALATTALPSGVKRTTRRLRSTSVTPSSDSSSRMPAESVDCETIRGLGRAAEMAVLVKRDEVLQLLDGREVGGHSAA